MTWYLRNTWYAAAFINELEEADFVARTICDVPMVMFRRKDGSVAALHDRCPHRLVPLSMGWRKDDTIQCGYHGLRFDGEGTCVELPFEHGQARPDVCVDSYPLVERDTICWVWMGDKDKADQALIPDFGVLTDPDFGHARDHSRFKCNYQILCDNLLDLSHIHYLHPGVHDGSNFADFKNEVSVEGSTIWSMLYRPGYVLDDAKREAWGLKGETCDGQGHSRWTVPGMMFVDTAFWDHGADIESAARHPSTHLLTPETEFSSHYLWVASRNYGPRDAEAMQQVQQGVRAIFETQDGPMAEAQQRAMGEETDLLKLHPAILKADKAGVLARRPLQRLIREENGFKAEEPGNLVREPLG